MSSRGPDGRFLPKKPKARKKKTEEEKKAIRARNKAEDAREDDVSRQRRRVFQTYQEAGRLGGIDISALSAVADNLPFEEPPGPQSPTYSPPSPTYAPGSPEPDRVYEPFPEGELIKGKNLNKRQRAHNRAVMEARAKANTTWKPELSYPEQELASYMAEIERKLPNEVSKGRPSWGPKTTLKAMKPMESPFGIGDSFVPGSGDYLTDIQLADFERQGLARLREIEAFEYNQQMRQDVAVSPRVVEDIEILVTPQEEAEHFDKLKALLKKKRKAQKSGASREEIRRIDEEIQEQQEGPEGPNVVARKRREERRAETSAPVTFIPQGRAGRIPMGTANIENGMVKTSYEVGRRPLTEEEQQVYMGGGITGQTETYVAPEDEADEEVEAEPIQRYARRKTQKLNQFRNQKVFTSTYEAKDPTETEIGMTEEELIARIERLPTYPDPPWYAEWAGQINRPMGYTPFLEGDELPEMRDPKSYSKRKPRKAPDTRAYRRPVTKPVNRQRKGPDPGGRAFLPSAKFAGVVDGYVYKTGDKGAGYYRR
jgi:hypothetical protein